jgi:uncharacterized protein (TIGR02145 family)
LHQRLILAEAMVKCSNITASPFLIFAIISVLLCHCKREDDNDIQLPLVSTGSISYLSINAAGIKSEVISEGGSPVTARGVCWSTLPQPTINDSKTNKGTGPGSFTSDISGLEMNVLYYVRAYATNSDGTSYGGIVSFRTTHLPVLSTSEAAYATQSTMVSGGVILDDGGQLVIKRGVCWSTHSMPTVDDPKTIDGEGGGSFSSLITGMSINTTYYLRAYASTLLGTGYGNEIIGKTTDYGIVADHDGNIYKTVTINDQTWMAENLKVIHYRNGDPIPNVPSYTLWPTLLTGAYCLYWDNESIASIYGKLYNYYAATDERNICPVGWHVPGHSDWSQLINFVGNEENAGGILKEKGLVHWSTPNLAATNSYYFNFLPAGYRDEGFISGLNEVTGYWTSTPQDNEYARFIMIFYNSESSYIYYNKKSFGFSIRCIKD